MFVFMTDSNWITVTAANYLITFNLILTLSSATGHRGMCGAGLLKAKCSTVTQPSIKCVQPFQPP